MKITQAINNANKFLDESASWNNFSSGSFNAAADRQDRMSKGDAIDKLIVKFERAGHSVFRNTKRKTVTIAGREMSEKDAIKKMKRILHEETQLTEKNSPSNPALWKKAIAKAKSKFDVYPSAYANAWAAKWYKSKGGSWEKVSEGKKGLDDKSVYSDSGLGKWAKQDWVDISRKDKDGKHPSCGRKDADGKGYPKCRPAKSAGKLSSKEKKSAVSRKRDAESRDKSNPKGDKPNMVKTKLKEEGKDWTNDAEFLKLARKAMTTGLPGSAARKKAIKAFNVKRKEYGLEPIKEEKKADKPLNKPFRTPGGPKKFSVYVKNAKGNIVKVNFGDPNMEIKRDDPERRKNFRARHNCADKKDKTTAGYWSCRQWSAGAKVEESSIEEADATDVRRAKQRQTKANDRLKKAKDSLKKAQSSMDNFKSAADRARAKLAKQTSADLASSDAKIAALKAKAAQLAARRKQRG
jgi:hypothetical protein